MKRMIVAGILAGMMSITGVAVASPANAATGTSTLAQLQAVRYAVAQVGKPYRLGANGPRAFDCSGLVEAAFWNTHHHIRLPHSAARLSHRGHPVSLKHLQPGDLLFPNRHHVAIYIGGGRAVYAPRPGERVKIRKVKYLGIKFARRIVVR